VILHLLLDHVVARGNPRLERGGNDRLQILDQSGHILAQDGVASQGETRRARSFWGFKIVDLAAISRRRFLLDCFFAKEFMRGGIFPRASGPQKRNVKPRPPDADSEANCLQSLVLTNKLGNLLEFRRAF